MTRIYDVSMGVRAGGLVYPGNPEVHVTAQQALAQGASANVSRIDFGSHTGTHVDAPKHFFDAGTTVDRLPLDALIGPAMLVEFAGDVMAVTEAALRTKELAGRERILIHTRNSGFLRNLGSQFVGDYTYLAPDGAAYLASLGVKLVGIDYLSIEQFHSGHHMTHRTLLERGIVIVEGLDLSDPPEGPCELICLPIKMEGLDGAPARAVLVA